jgi:hypothetical protein
MKVRGSRRWWVELAVIERGVGGEGARNGEERERDMMQSSENGVFEV